MAVMLGNLYGALVAAGAPDEKAQKASEEVAVIRDEVLAMKNDVTGLRGDIQLLKWMLGFTLAGVVTIIGIGVRLLGS